jgi:SPX domain protein involved in polyphosphate accumulation
VLDSVHKYFKFLF